MKHLGDITKIDWFKVEPVDVVTGGSPCQDLSVAGKRAGLAGERSGLYMEQIICVKELRQADVQRCRTGQFIRPRYMVWENVPGAFSSGNPKGSDFAAVIEEIIKICEPGTSVCIVPPRNGWTKSGCYYADDGRWSIAWRVHDAQFWGVPQRRKRIALVADFGGLSAPEILFERKGLSGHFEQSGAQREGSAAAVGDGAAGAISFQERAGRPGGGKGILIQPERTGALSTLNNQSVFCLQGNGIDRADTAGCNGKGWREDVSYTLNTIDRPAVAFAQNQRDEVRNLMDVAGSLAAESGMKQQTFVMCLNDQGGSVMSVSEDVSGCLRAQEHGHQPIVAGFKGGQGKGSIAFQEEIAATLQAEGSGIEPTVYDARGNGNGEVAPTMTGDHQNRITDYTAIVSTYQEVTGPLMANSHPGSYTGQDAYNDMLVAKSIRANGSDPQREGHATYPITANIVRRLTPLECERLQGYPDGWTDIGEWVDSKGKKHKEADSPRYKALGNSIALPFWCWLAKRISAQYERDITMGSLFDGIGGFPYAFEKCGGKALWASEIEEFPMAVTKLRFPE